MKTFFPVLLLGFGLLSTNPVAAQEPDFTFQVPVELADLHPDVVEVGVRCDLYDGYGQWYLGEDLPSGRYFFSDREPISGRAFSGIITVEISYPGYTVEQKRSANGYNCALYLGNGTSFEQPSSAATEDWLRLSEGIVHNGGQFAN